MALFWSGLRDASLVSLYTALNHLSLLTQLYIYITRLFHYELHVLGVTRQSQESSTATQLGTRWNGAAPSCTAKGARRRVQNCDPAVGSWLRDLCVELGEL